jgi:hypothetical protein
MGDVPSRSFEEGFLEGSDKNFLAYFAHRLPLPPSFPHTFNGQPDSWQLVTPLSGIVSAVILLLQKSPDTSTDPTVTIGDSGWAIPHLVTKTLASSVYKETHSTIWNAANCSWPLLDPSGKVSSMVADLLPE